MSKKRKVLIMVEAEVDREADKESTRDFVIEALETWGGQRHPNDPLFRSISVKKIKLLIDDSKNNYW